MYDHNLFALKKGFFRGTNANLILIIAMPCMLHKLLGEEGGKKVDFGKVIRHQIIFATNIVK